MKATLITKSIQEGNQIWSLAKSCLGKGGLAQVTGYK